MELSKMRKDMELTIVQYESSDASMRKKHQDAMNEFSEQIDFLSKNKNKYVAIRYYRLN